MFKVGDKVRVVKHPSLLGEIMYCFHGDGFSVRFDDLPHKLYLEAKEIELNLPPEPSPHPWNENREMLQVGDLVTWRKFNGATRTEFVTKEERVDDWRYVWRIIRVKRPTYRDVPEVAE